MIDAGSKLEAVTLSPPQPHALHELDAGFVQASVVDRDRPQDQQARGGRIHLTPIPPDRQRLVKVHACGGPVTAGVVDHPPKSEHGPGQLVNFADTPTQSLLVVSALLR